MRAELGAEVSQRWLLYALGGGFGHLTRSLALARALQAASPQLDLHFVTNSPYARTALLDSELRADKSSETRRASVHVLDSNCGNATAISDSISEITLLHGLLSGLRLLHVSVADKRETQPLELFRPLLGAESA